MASQNAGQGFGVAQAERLVARFNGFESRYDDSPYARFMLRMRRGTSWLARAEEDLFGRETPDPDAAFVFYWIAFNAAYADNRADGTERGERARFNDYFGQLLFHDKDDAICGALRDGFSKETFLSFINNQYLYWRFWEHHGGNARHSDWQAQFERENRRAEGALDRVMPRGNAMSLGAIQERQRAGQQALGTLFDRMYVFRNQMVHGGATYQSKVTGAQVRDGARIMALLVPMFLDLMMDNPKVDWGVPRYPPVF